MAKQSNKCPEVETALQRLSRVEEQMYKLEKNTTEVVSSILELKDSVNALKDSSAHLKESVKIMAYVIALLAVSNTVVSVFDKYKQMSPEQIVATGRVVRDARGID